MELQLFLDAGEKLFASLEQETLACLKDIESLSVPEIECFQARRQELLAAIQNFDTELHAKSGLVQRGADLRSLEMFRQRQSAVLGRVIETDGLLLAIAGSKLKSLMAQQTSISRGRHALHCYREENGNSRFPLNRVA
ncbi:MAG: hypothetical protein M0023_12790 [Desulfobacteraceae bacterium]|nr:hypothetical protein [Desulfobacteraceae bacterium]